MTGVVWAAIGVMSLLVSGCSQGYSGGGSIKALGGGGSIEPTVAIKLDAVAGETAGDAAADVAVAGYGTVSGRVILEGAAPVLGPLLPGGELRDPSVCIRDQIQDFRVMTGPDGGLANAFVFLPRKPAGAREVAPAPTEPIKFDQKTCTFIPHALLVRAKQEVLILNSDAIAHNTHTSNGSFNSNVAPGNQTGVPLVYTRGEREPVRVTCDFHTWMLAWHLPLDHPYAALTGPDGAFTIADVPAGKHKFVVWHEGKKLGDYTVEVQPDQTTPLDITIPSASLAQAADPNATKAVVLSFGAP
jgi:hypothetical protein